MALKWDNTLRFDKTVLENGLTIIGENNPQAQTMAIGYFVMTGARDETSDVAGVSHFLEHMMFKGTETRTAEDINREFDRIGASYNAFTSDERTVYYGAVLPEYSSQLIDLLTDMLRPTLRQSDFEMEKKVILEEIAMYKDRPASVTYREGKERYFGVHPLGNSVLGSAETVGNMSREQMLAYFESRYAPNNLVVTITGRYDWQAVVEQISTATQTWQVHPSARQYPSFNQQRTVYHEKRQDEKLKRTHIAMFASGLSWQDPKRVVASLVANCLGDAVGSRIFWALIDPGLADQADFSHDSCDGMGTFSGYLSTSPDQAAKTLDVFKQVLFNAQAGSITPNEHTLTQEEWTRAQNKMATRITLGGETPFRRLMSLGSSYQYLETYLTIPERIAKVKAVTLEEGLELLSSKPFDELYSFQLEPTQA